MALILAIEPDRRQASQLTAMVRGRLHAELVLADSAERALSALGDRVPDLVLTSALLSPKDETALGERLRALDGHAAHVQTLTIPVLATTSKRGSSRATGVLSSLRRDKKKSSAVHDGCDPAVFAEQCKEYLERAAAERAAFLEEAASASRIKEPVRPVSPSPVTGAEWVVVREEAAPADPAEPVNSVEVAPAEPAPIAEPDVEAYEPPPASFARASEKAPIYTPPEYRAVAAEPAAPEAGSEYAAFAEPIDTTLPQAAVPASSRAEPEPIAWTDAPTAETSDASPRVDRVLKEFLDLTSDNDGPASLLAAVAALEAEERSYAAAAATEPPVETPVQTPVEMPAPAEPEFVDLSALLQPASSGSMRPASSDSDNSVDVYEIDASVLGSLDLTAEAGVEPERLATLSDLEAIFKSSPDFTPAPPPPPQPTPAKPLDSLKEWDDIVEALRREAEQLEARQPAAADATAVPAPPPRPIELPRIEITPAAAVRTEPAPTQPAASPAAQPAAPPVAPPAPQDVDAAAGDADANAAKKRRKRAKPSPAQDEWGFFDPDQCGFAALIEKLEEISDQDDPPTPRGA